MLEWLEDSLQNYLHQFESDLYLQKYLLFLFFCLKLSYRGLAHRLEHASYTRQRIVRFYYPLPQGVEQLECSPRLERGGRWFKSNHPDQQGGFYVEV